LDITHGLVQWRGGTRTGRARINPPENMALAGSVRSG